MKHKIRNTIISLIDALGISFLYRAYMRRKGPLVRVICFHDVQNREWFEAVIELLAREFRVITPEQFHSQDFDPEKINILITFDDGYQSWIDNCLPILDAYGFKAIFFITSGLLDSAEEGTSDVFMRGRLLITPKKPLTWEGARKLLDAGHEIGGHTRTHARLSETFAEECVKEIEMDKNIIEQKLTVRLIDFAYPFGKPGDRTKESTNIISEAGYKFIYTTDSGFAVQNEFSSILRLCIEKAQSINRIRSWIEGAYDLFAVSLMR